MYSTRRKYSIRSLNSWMLDGIDEAMHWNPRSRLLRPRLESFSEAQCLTCHDRCRYTVSIPLISARGRSSHTVTLTMICVPIPINRVEKRLTKSFCSSKHGYNRRTNLLNLGYDYQAKSSSRLRLNARYRRHSVQCRRRHFP